MCSFKGYGFSAALIVNRVSILAILPPFSVGKKEGIDFCTLVLYRNGLSRAPVGHWAPGLFELKLTRH